MEEQPVLTLRSTIKPSLKKNQILRGSLLGGLGVIIWLYGALFLSLNTLATWGWLILILGGLFIAWGLVPYRKLMRLENRPHKIILTDLDELYFLSQNITLFKVELKNVEEMAYLDDNERYGIGLWIKNPMKNIQTLHPSLQLEEYLKDTRKRYLCDLFFPFFSKPSYQELEDFYKTAD